MMEITNSFNKKLTDYSEWSKWEWSHGIELSTPHSYDFNFNVDYSRWLKTPEVFSKKIFGQITFPKCPYCSYKMKYIEGSESKDIIDSYTGWEIINVYRVFCLNCGWWFIQSNYNRTDYSSQNIDYSTTVYEGIIRRFNLESNKLPITTLRNHLENNYNDIHYIHPTVFEKLVADIFKDFFDCEVRHVGRSGDNGMDVYAVISNEPHLIQVKSHKSPKKAESVKIVREIIGALLAHNIKKGYLVTSASDYSKQAKKLVHNPNLKRYCIELKLLNKNDLFEMLNIAQLKIEKVWEGIKVKSIRQ